MVKPNWITNKKSITWLIAVLIAFLLLIATKLSNTYTKNVTLAIRPVNLPKTTVLNDSLKLQLTLQAKGYKWLLFNKNKPSVTIDFKDDVKNKDSVYIWSSAASFFKVAFQLPKGITLKAITTKQLHFKYDFYKTKKIPIQSNVAIHFAKGYNSLKAMQLQPDSVTVIAPQKILSKMQYIATDTLVLHNINASFTKRIGLNVKALSHQVKLDTKVVNAKAIVEKFTEGTITVPLLIINPPEGKQLNYFPKAVQVSYNTSLSAFKTILAGDFKVVCDYNKINKTSRFLIPELVKYPESVTSVRVHQQKIEFIVIK